MPTTRCGSSAGGRGAGALGWLNRKIYEQTGDEQKSQGWTPIVLDTNGNGKRDAYVEPNQPVDPTKDKRIAGALYGIGVNPQRRHDLGLGARTIPGYIMRVDPGAIRRRPRSPKIYEPPVAGLRPARHATSTATASSGCRSRAATWRASTAASARAR